MITFSLYSSSKAKMKNGSFPRAGEKLIGLNRMKKVVVCLGLCWVQLWKETGADSFWKHHKSKNQLFINQILWQKPFVRMLFVVALVNVVFCLWSSGWRWLCCAPAPWDWSSGPLKSMSKLLCSLSPSLRPHKGLSVPSPVQKARKSCLIYFPTTAYN